MGVPGQLTGQQGLLLLRHRSTPNARVSELRVRHLRRRQSCVAARRTLMSSEMRSAGGITMPNGAELRRRFASRPRSP